MSQPEMPPGEAPRRGGAPGRPAGRGGAGDLHPWAFPAGDWAEPAEYLDALFRWAEQQALHTVRWYLRDRVWKRRCARLLRLAVVALAAAGAGLLLPSGAGGRGGWGCAALLAAAGCAGVDRWLGLTSGWVRDVATAQEVQRRLEAFRFDWAAQSVREVLGPHEGTAAEATERCLGVVRRFCEDLSHTVRAETAQWVLEFRPSLLGPEQRPPAPGTPPYEPGPVHARFVLPPGSRPSMPRQRPPEAPR